MNFADLHCDTPYELYKTKQNITSNELHISLNKCDNFSRYIQTAAIWSDFAKSNDECYTQFFDICNYFKKQAGYLIRYNSGQIRGSGRTSFVLAVEDARLLNGNLKRLDKLYNAGVRLMTLTWKDVSCIGGSWNTAVGLTDFGYRCVEKMFEVGIIPDISHGSKALLLDVCKIAKSVGKPFCATHSDSFSVCPHRRNLTDDDAKLIVSCGGIVGISMCPFHLASKNAKTEHIINHIDHYISVIGEDSVAFGCDFDGVASLPQGINDITSIKYVFSESCLKFGERISEKIFFNNAYNFLLTNI